jgi:quinol monooxygenase YgiN
MARVDLWVEWDVQENAAEQFDQLLKEIIDCVRAEEPHAYSFWGFRHPDARTYHLFEGFDSFESAREHLSGAIGPVAKYVPLQNKIAKLTGISIHGELTAEQSAELTGLLGGTYYATVAGFHR